MDYLNMYLMLIAAVMGSYFVLKPSFASWSVPELKGRERFARFEHQWPAIFAFALCVGIVVAWYTYERVESAPIGFILGYLATMFSIASWTDMNVYKVPADLSRLTLWVAITFMGVMVATNTATDLHTIAGADAMFLPRVYWGDFLPFLLFNIALALVGFMIIRKTGKMVMLYVGVLLMTVGAYLTIYGLLSASYTAGWGPYWSNFFHHLLIAWVFIGVALMYDLLLPRDSIGGADTIIFYTLGFGVAFWLGAYNMFIGLIIAFALQLLFHLVARKLGFGYEKEVRNGAFRQARLNRKYKKENADKIAALEEDNYDYETGQWKEKVDVYAEVPKTHMAWAAPFIPALFLGTIGTTLFFIS